MNSSGNILEQIQMFVTDADGTVMGRRPEFDQYRAFRASINKLRGTYGAKWVVCTGRSLGGYKRIFHPMKVFGIVPDYVISRHAYIYECRKWGFLPHWIWNFRILWLQWKDEMMVRRALPKLRKAVLSCNPFARVAYSTRARLCFRFEDEGATEFGAEIVRKEARPYRYLQVFQAPGEVDVRVIPFTKGLAVTELARHLGVPNPRILVVGDGHNDISMMTMQPPCHTACPANAASEVLETVHRTGGHIAKEASLGGVMEILGAYEAGRINSALPDDWSGYDRPGHAPKTAHHHQSGIFSIILIALVIYATLLVVSYFCNMPGRERILTPYFKMIELITDKPVGAGTVAPGNDLSRSPKRKDMMRVR